MSELSKSYEPTSVENKWYSLWLENGCFKGEPKEGQTAYSIMIPPPNVTGVLTMGHVLNNTIQDILVRRARQDGKNALWLPGTDHAGIATQTRVEKELRKEGLTRRDLGREKFVERASTWRDQHGGIIIEQLKKLGASCDWDRTVHTLDDDYSNSVLTAFVKLFKQGHIYRGKRMVNWCPVSCTALSDEEVIMTPQKGIFYKMKYEIVERPNEFIEISTTRPETIMGDTAVAVHPDDDRYKDLIGLHCWRPFPKAKIKIVADRYVDKDFGTGALKITPAHDRADFDLGQRHNLEIIDIMNPDGTLNELAGEDFAGKDRFVARKIAAKKLKELGLLIKEEPYENNVGFSERAGCPIEPRLSEQWFLKYPCIEEAKKVIKDKLIKFWPQRWEKTYLHWLENIQDWCISRQLWWGHRIPVWYKKGIAMEDIDFSDENQVYVSTCPPADPENWVQDEDSLDTWASSWLWPFATLGWPNKEKMQEKGFDFYFPTDDLVTGPDIIFFWVARMIMASLFLNEGDSLEEKIPFKNVYFTGIIRDMQGKKMSKSLGNSPDPLDLIAKYGADGLRFGVISCAPQGQDILFDEARVELGRNFCNKLWNGCRFRQVSGDSYDNSSLDAILSRIDINKLSVNENFILSKLSELVSKVQSFLKTYEFSPATNAIYSFYWGDFCDYYLEASKVRLKNEDLKPTILAVQDLCIRQILLLLHPFTPFITQELWQKLGYGNSFVQNENSSFEPFDEKMKSYKLSFDESSLLFAENIRKTISDIRAKKAENNLQKTKDSSFVFTPNDDACKMQISENLDIIKSMIGAGQLVFANEKPEGNLVAIISSFGTFYLDLASSLDPKVELEKLNKELVKVENAINSTNARLSNEAFVSKAPPQVIQGAKKQLSDLKTKKADLQKAMQMLAK